MRKLRMVVLIWIFVVSLAFLVCNAKALTTTTIQPSSQDSCISATNPDQNWWNAANIGVAVFSSDMHRILVQFDLSSIPSGATIMSATLKLYYWGSSYAPVGRTYQAYQVTQSWTDVGVTWNKYDGTSSWATAGGDYTTAGGASATVPSSNGWMTWDVTDIVKAWISG